MEKSRQFQRTPLACRGQSNHQIKRGQIIPPLFHLVKTARAMTRKFDAEFLTDRDGKPINFKIVHDTDRLDISARAIEFFHNAFGHRRPNRVVITTKQNRLWEPPVHDYTPKCKTQIRVNNRRAVSLSIMALPSNR